MRQLDLVSLFLDAIDSIPLGSVALKVTLVLGLATAACALLHRQSAAIRHRIWVLALGVTLALPLASLLPQFELRVLPGAVDSTRQDLAMAQRAPQAPASIAPAEVSLPKSDAGLARPEPALQNRKKTASSTAMTATGLPPNSITEPLPARSAMSHGIGHLLALVWLLGTVIVSLLFVVSLAIQAIQLGRLRRVNDDEWTDLMNEAARRLGLQRPLVTLESDRSCVPAVVGILTPRLVIPHDWRTWSLAQRNCILLHELAHVKRLDVSAQFIGRLALLVYWFHPLAWFAVRQLRAERELASDDCVLLAGAAASDYAEELLRTLRHYRPVRPALGVAMAHSARLDQRVLAILDTRRCRTPLGSRTAIALFCLFGVLSGVLGGGTLASRPLEDPAATLNGDWTLTLPAGFQSPARLQRVAADAYQLHSEPGSFFAGRYRHEEDRLTLVKKDSLGRDLKFVWKLSGIDSAELVEEPPVELTGTRYLGATLKRWEQQALDPRKLVGVWNCIKYVGVQVTPWQIEFRGDGEYLQEGRSHEVIKTYSLKNNRLTFQDINGEGKSVTVMKLTDDVLIYDDSGKTFEFQKEPDGKSDKNNEKKPLTKKELTGKWFGEAENKDGIRKLVAHIYFDRVFGGDVHWRLRYETEESGGAEIGTTGHRVENAATGRVDLYFRKTVLGHLARGEGDTILLTILPEFEKNNMPGERAFRRFEGLVLRRMEEPDARVGDLKALQGRWTVVEERGSDPLEKSRADQIKGGDLQWVFSGSKFAPALKGSQLTGWTDIRLDSNPSPKQMHTLEMLSLFDRTQAVRSTVIYELKGDDLRVFGWVPQKGAAPTAPKDFDPKNYPGEKWTLTTLKRTTREDKKDSGQPKQGGKEDNPVSAKRLQESLRGKWQQESRMVNSKRHDDPDGVFLLVTDDGMMQTYSPVKSSEGPGPTLVQNVHYRIDATRDPVTVDTAGRTDWTDASEGILRLEKDSLALCFAAKNKPRPTTFSTGADAGMGEVLIVYKRTYDGK